MTRTRPTGKENMQRNVKYKLEMKATIESKPFKPKELPGNKNKNGINILI